MKKGFTIVEIIISISIILIVGISTTFFVFNNKKNTELVNITKKILEAANLYASTEKDEEGNIYLNKIKTGKKGLKIPLINLVNKGYISEFDQQKVLKLTNEVENHYIMLIDGNVEEEKNYCEDNAIISLASWIDEDTSKDIYLCNSKHIEANKSLIYTITNGLEAFRFADILGLDGYIKEDDYYILDANGTTITESGALNGTLTTHTFESFFYSTKQNGLGWSNSSPFTFNFRGSVNNNYIQINDEIFRIVKFIVNEGSNVIYLIKENAINSKYYNESSIPIETDYNKNTDFNNTRIYDALQKWFNDFTKDINKEIFYNEKPNLLQLIDAKNAGIYPYKTNYRINDTLYDRKSSTYYSVKDFEGNIIGNSWLSQGDSTIISYNIVDKFAFISNDMHLNNSETQYGTLGALHEISIDYYKNNKENIAKKIRPVIIINDDKITSVSGTGTKENPYILNY